MTNGSFQLRSRKESRLHYLLSRENGYYLNGIYRLRRSREYTSVYGQSYIPKPLLNNTALVRVYVVLFFFVYATCLSCKLISVLIKKKSIVGKAPNFSRLFLLTSQALPRIAKHANVIKDDDYWLSPLNYNNVELNQNRIVGCLQMVDNKQLFFSYCDSLKIFCYTLRRRGFRYPLGTLDSFQWLIYYWALQNTDTNVTLLFCSHMDVWTVLIDKAPQHNKIHLQHGTEIIPNNSYDITFPNYRFIEDKGFWTLNIPYKYSSVNQTYVFSENEYLAVCSAVFLNQPQKVIVGYSLVLSDIKTSNKSVLIVGFYRSYREIEEKLLEQLKDYNVDVYLKKHPSDPTEKYNTLRERYDFHFIDTLNFPRVNLVLSYDSTLALEYESLGVDVLYYCETTDIRELVESVVKRLDLEENE